MQTSLNLAAALAAFSIVACNAGNGVSFGGDVVSGITAERARNLASLRGCEWVAGEQRPLESENSSPETGRTLTVALSEQCVHLGVSGAMTLEFADDRLMALKFEPTDPAAYGDAVEQVTGVRLDAPNDSHSTEGLVLRRIQERGQTIVVWRDGELTNHYLSE